MKLLHTSDWHLGRSLYGRKRYDEFAAFLDWLYNVIVAEGIDVLLVAGDIFDTGSPGNRAQELYYQFLCRVAAASCQHIVVIAGNHDSPSFLNAPKAVLRTLNIHVSGSITGNPADEVLVLAKDGGREAVIICAVPYLRDKDIRSVAGGESTEDKNRKLREGIKEHYARVIAVAESRRAELRLALNRTPNAGIAAKTNPPIPIIAMGHLFTAGARTVDGDGVRELYVGSLAHIDKDEFPPTIDYLALGHLHIPQTVGGTEHIRYSGAPLAMGFAEAKQTKSVIVLKFRPTAALPGAENAADHPPKNAKKNAAAANPAPATATPAITLLPIPTFQPLIRISGGLAGILDEINRLRDEQSRAWLEIEYTDSKLVSNLREQIEEALAGTAMAVIRIKNRQVFNRVLRRINETETLDDLDEQEVFRRCLESSGIDESDRPEMLAAFNEVIRDLAENENP